MKHTVIVCDACEAKVEGDPTVIRVTPQGGAPMRAEFCSIACASDWLIRVAERERPLAEVE
jgi:predicted metal-binding protein